MQPDLVIKFLFKNYEPFLERMSAASRVHWSELLFGAQVDETTFTYTHFNRLKSEVSTPGFILSLLKQKEVLNRVEAKLACPGLWLCSDSDELYHLLSAHLAPVAHRSAEAALIVPASLKEEGAALSEPEKTALKRIADRIAKEASGVACWRDAPAVGAPFMAYALGADYLEPGRKAYLIRPYEGFNGDVPPRHAASAPFEQSLLELRRHLGLPVDASDRNVLRALRANNAMLLVLAPGLLESSRSALRSLVKIAAAEQRNGTVIVLIGAPKAELAGCRSFDQQLEVWSTTKKSAYFHQQWKRFCELRGHLPADEQGTRLKRARAYFATETDVSTSLASIRMLAFLASNYDTFSYFDPTAGWSELSNLRHSQLPVDIRLHVDEMYALLCPWMENSPVMRSVRWCSTALYWLTEDAVSDLVALHHGMKIETFIGSVEKVHGRVVTTAPETPANEAEAKSTKRREIYKMDLTARALVQDMWAQRDALDRARVHHAIANRLYKNCNKKELLNSEFPVEPHWGRSRIHFLSESLRHLIRACDSADAFPANFAVKEFPTPAAFPAAPSLSVGTKGCNPYEVVNFCFTTIFWQELNGNSRVGRIHNRKLARQHGAYQLTGELLELLSADRILGRPHQALDPRHHARYYREVMYAQLDLGDLDGALRSCERLIRLSEDDLKVSSENVEYQLDRVVVLTTMNRLDTAERRLDDIETFVGLMVEKPEKIDNRLRARRAQLHYLRGDIAAAIKNYEVIAESDPAAITRDVAHTYIASLGAIGEESHLKRALTICCQNLFENSSRGLHHTALGFRVALAHLLRRMDMLSAAEATLDQVLVDILQFGCSERSYLAFMLEAGRVVSQSPQRVARAYAAYLRPCLDRAVSLGYLRTARSALVHAERCLRTLMVHLSSEPGDSASSVRDMLVDENRIDFVSRRPDIDPRYGFGAAQVEAWLPRLRTLEAVAAELAEISATGVRVAKRELTAAEC